MKQENKSIGMVSLIILAIMFTLSLFSSAFAIDQCGGTDSSSIKSEPILYSPMGTTVPTAPHSLPYSGSFSGVKAGVYTNYYFTGTTTLNVAVTNITINKNQTTKLMVNLYDVTSHCFLWGTSSDILPYNTSSSFYASLTGPGLTSSHNYAVFFWSSNSFCGISANFSIYT